MKEAQLKKLAKLVAKDLVENAFDIPSDNARDFIEDLASEKHRLIPCGKDFAWHNNPVAKLASELLDEDKGDDDFWDMRELVDILIERARKAALATLKTVPRHTGWRRSKPRLGGSKKRKR